MELGKYSKNRILQEASAWEIPRGYVDPIYNYLIYGIEPGSFFTAVLCNDFFSAMGHSHPGNSVQTLKNLINWICSMNGRNIFWGNEKIVNSWLKMKDIDRRKKLEELGIIFPEQDEILMILRDEPCREPLFFD